MVVEDLIIDGNNMGFMAFGRTPLLNKGKRVELIYVGLNMVKSWLEKFNPERCFIVWDGGRNKERLKLFPDYKKKKKEFTQAEIREREEFISQIKQLREFFKALGLVQYRCKEQEADDVIFSILDENRKSLIVSTDKDFYQILVSDNVKVYNPIKKIVINKELVEQEFGVPVEFVLAYRAMAGDPSDALPGIKGFGAKRASWLVNEVLNSNDFSKAKSFTSSQKRLIDCFLENLEAWQIMYDVMKLKKVDEETLLKGKIEFEYSCLESFHEEVINLLDKYGFEKHLKNFDSFISPFVRVLSKRRSKK